MRKFFTSESVSEGHPDKICDQVSDAILDAHLAGDADSHVACETLVTTDFCLLAGEVKSHKDVDYVEVARNTIRDIGYTVPDQGFKWDENDYLVKIHAQSPDIDHGVSAEHGAGDQGIMFGYACMETGALMPYPIQFAHRLLERLADARKSGELTWALPDAKSQVTVEYEDDRPVFIREVLMSVHHTADAQNEDMADDIREKVVKVVLQSFDPHLEWSGDLLYNPSGRFAIGGPHGDAGLTGRKVIVDTYGGEGRHGGGAFSGKDPTKVDRSATYMARHIAKNVVACGASRRCEVQLAYAIGKPEPRSVRIDTFGTANIDPGKIEKAVREVFPLRPYKIIEYLDLLRPIYCQTAAYGHFGRQPGGDGAFTWEKTDRADDLRRLLF